MKGCFITFEGIDGAGKSSHIQAACDQIGARGLTVVQTREPGGTELAEAIRGLVLQHDMSALSEALLVFAARHDHLERTIKPALEAGSWVVCDRFSDSSMAYQGHGRGLGSATISWLAEQVHGGFEPDRTYWFDVAPELAARRVQGRAPADRFEREQAAFFSRVAHGYTEIAHKAPTRVLRIDASLGIEAVAQALARDLSRMLDSRL